MDIFLVRKTDYVPEEIIDDFISFIWTERYDEAGDFELVVAYSKDMAEKLKVYEIITHNETTKGMFIDEYDDQTDEDGVRTITIRGKSMESILDTRAVTPNVARSNHWRLANASPGQACNTLVTNICGKGMMSPNDRIPNLSIVVYTEGGPKSYITVRPQSLYDAVVELARSDNLGFQIDIKSENFSAGNTSMLFKMYRGKEREDVVFSSILDSLQEEQRYHSIKDYYNVAYVWAKDCLAHEIVYAPGVPSSISGFNRRAMNVDAYDIDPEDEDNPYTAAELKSVLQTRGKEALSKQKEQNLLDGEASPYSDKKYRKDYFIGDIVTLIDDTNRVEKVRVIEYIWVMDGEGKRAYPTFRSIELE